MKNRELKSVQRLASRIRSLREAAGLTQAGLAERAGVSDGAIKMIETARRQPRAETLEAIAKAFGISVDDIHGGPRPEPPPPLAPDQLKAIREAAREGAAQSELTLEQRVLLRHFGSAGAERQALALWILSEDPHYLQEFEAAALERGREATSLSDALTGLISQSKKSLG